MLEQIKQDVFNANMELPRRGLITYTWGNVSGRDTASGNIIIKPSGVAYEQMTVESMVVVDPGGRILEGELHPSSDLPTHLALYRKYPDIHGIVHTHSRMATSWAQAGRDIPFYGTTHADYFRGPIPCTRVLREEEVISHYEHNTGLVIIETLDQKGLRVEEMPGILCANHGVFTWGKDAADAVHNAVVLEELANMAVYTELLNPRCEEAPQYLLNKHYDRKHGRDAYYGQKNN